MAGLSLLLQATNLTSAPTSFPAYFFLYTLLFALLILYYLLLSPRATGTLIQAVLQRLLSWAWGGGDSAPVLRISGVGFALLSGKIYLNHVEYRTKNIAIRVLQATVRINWWFTEVREADSKHDGQWLAHIRI